MAYLENRPGLFSSISAPKGVFSSSKLQRQSIYVFDRLNERNTMVESIMHFYKVPKLTQPIWETG